MRTLLTFIAVLLTMAFFVVTLAVIFFHPWGAGIFRAGVYKQALAEDHIYERIPVLVGPLLLPPAAAAADAAPPAAGAAENVERDNPSQGVRFRKFEPADWEVLLGSVLPPAAIQAEVEQHLDQIESFLHAAQENPPDRLSLAGLKRRLVDPQGSAAYAATLAAKPPCPPAAGETAPDLPTTCRPAPEQIPVVIANHQRLVRALADLIPDEINLTKMFTWRRVTSGGETVPGEPRRPQAVVQQVEDFARWSPIGPVGLALLMVVLAARSVREVFLWLGIPCLLVGLLGAGIAGGLGHQVTELLAQGTSASPSDHAQPQVSAVMIPILTGVTRVMFNTAFWTSITLGTGGLIVVLLAAKMPPPQPAPRPSDSGYTPAR